VTLPTTLRAVLTRRIREQADLLGAAATGFALMVPVLASSNDYLGSGSDLLTLEYPQLAFAVRWARQGVVPLWDPLLYDGVPFPAGVQAYFYPPSWLALWLPLGLTIKLLFALHLALAGAGAAWLCRPRVRSRLASYLGGAIFALSGFLTSHMFAGHLHLVAAAAYLPWIVGIVDRVRRREPLSWPAAVVCFALALLAANYQMVAIALLAAVLLAGLDGLVQRRPGTSWRAHARGAGRVLGVVAALLLGSAIVSAVQLLPLAGTLPFTQRHSVDASFASSFPAVAGDFVSMLLPRFFGDGAGTPFVGDFSYWESFSYVGLVALALAASAIESLPRTRWLAPAIASVVGGLLALGDRTPLLSALCAIMPPFAHFRASGRFLVIVAVFAAMLAALGLDAFLAPDAAPARRRSPVVLAVAAFGAWMALAQSTPEGFASTVRAIVPVDPKVAPSAWPLVLDAARADALLCTLLLAGVAGVAVWGARPERRLRAAQGLVALAVLDVLLAARHDLATAPPQTFEWLAPLAAGCRERVGPGGRILATSELVAPDAGAPYDLASMAGYAIFLDDRYARFVNRAEGAPLDRFISPVLSDGQSPLLRHLGTDLVLTSLPAAGPDGRARLGIGTFRAVGGMGPRLKILAAESPAPRAALVHAIERIDDELEAYARMESASFDIARVALVEGDAVAPKTASPREGDAEEVSITTYEPNRVALDVLAASPGLVVLSDAYEPGWTATLDGAPALLVPANRIMRAVPVAPGEHQLIMTYWPPGLTAGTWLTACGSLALLGMAIAPRWRRRARCTPPGPPRGTSTRAARASRTLQG
jgi:hypothetical protein